mmetsp:Transcript_14178/g.42252  ORF Transcript_14178/g.42252 Transcript_14178/m.42252 type:complete len:319 (+) Transcript_14178:518-1474(+)
MVRGRGPGPVPRPHPHVRPPLLRVPERRHLRGGQQGVAEPALHRPAPGVDAQEDGQVRRLRVLQASHGAGRRVLHRGRGQDRPGPGRRRGPAPLRPQDPHLRLQPRPELPRGPRLRRAAAGRRGGHAGAPEGAPHGGRARARRQAGGAQVRHGPRDEVRRGRQPHAHAGDRAGRVAPQPPPGDGRAALVLQHPQPRALPAGPPALHRAGGRHDGGLPRRPLAHLRRGPRPHQRRLRGQHPEDPHAAGGRAPLRQLPRAPRPRHLLGRPLPRGLVVRRAREGPARGLRRLERELQAGRPPEQVREQVPRGLLLGAALRP